MKKIAALILALSLVCCSCGQDNPADDITENTTEAVTETVTDEVFDFVGKWQGVKIIEDGEELYIYDDIPIYACYQIELCEDGSVKLGETTAEIADHENSWRWNRTSKSTEIEFFDSEDDYDISTLTLDGGYLVYYEDSDDILYMEKVDEFTPYQPIEETTEKVTHEYISADPTAFTGKWEARKLTVRKDKLYLMSETLMEVCQLEIYDDYTAVISGVEISGSETPVTYTWGIVSETEIELVDDNGNIVFFTMDGDYLVCTVNKITVSLGRVDEFTPKESEDIEDSVITSFVGKWQGEYAVDENGEKITDDAIPILYQFEFNEDGTLSFGEFLAEVYDKGDYTWEVADSHTITLHYFGSEEDINLSFNGEYLVYSDYKDIYLARVDEFTPKKSEEIEDSSITPFVGKWQSSKLIINEDKHYLSEMPVSEICHIEINDDYTAVISGKEITGSENPVKYKCNDVSENKISLVDEDGNTVLLDYAEECFLYMGDDITVILKSVDEFTVIDPDFHRCRKIN
ncbi:MAG: hypothetical protein K2J40_04670 [Ruminococcus sp.]|nr:hypothetical protein [Ruminococcus sp.]